MEVRDGDEKLKKLLESLRIGVDDEKGQKNDPNVPPALPLIDQLRLLSVHIDTYRKSIADTVTKAESIVQIENHQRSGTQVQARLSEIERKIKRLSEDKQSTTDGTDVDLLQQNVSRTIAEYVKSKQEYEKRKQITATASALREAVLAIEQLEARIAEGDFEPKGIRETIAQAQKQCGRLGIRSGKDDLRIHNEFEWLTTGTSAPQAIQKLGQRFDLLVKQVDQIIHQSWHDCMILGFSENEGQASVTIRAQSSIKVGHRQFQLDLPVVLALLQDRAELVSSLKTFSNELIKGVITPMLESQNSVAKRNDWQIANNRGSWLASRSKIEERPESTLYAIIALLVYLKKSFFDMVGNPDLSVELQFELSRVVIPAAIPLLIQFLKRLLPKTLRKPIREETLSSLSTVSNVAMDIHSCLKDNGYLIRGLEEEGEHLLDFAHNTGRYFLRHLANTSRSRARDLLLKEMHGGWEGVKAEFEVEVIQPPPVVQVEPEQTRNFKAKEEADDEDWSAWDDAGVQGESLQSVPNVKDAKIDAKLARVPSTSSQRSASPASIASNRAKQKKSALGGVRVVKPQDQLGSGPFPDENLDESSWGFDEGDQSSSIQSSLNRAQDSAQTSVQIAEEEEDAWFQEESVAPASISDSNTSKSANNSILSAAPPPDDEDAWFQDEPTEAPLVSLANQSIRSNPPQPMEEEDDAWFQDQPADQSSAPIAPAIQTSYSVTGTSNSEVEHEDEGDAWFQESPVISSEPTTNTPAIDSQDTHQRCTQTAPPFQHTAHAIVFDDNHSSSDPASSTMREGTNNQLKSPSDVPSQVQTETHNRVPSVNELDIPAEDPQIQKKHTSSSEVPKSSSQSLHPLRPVEHDQIPSSTATAASHDEARFDEKITAPTLRQASISEQRTAQRSVAEDVEGDPATRLDPLVPTSGSSNSQTSPDSDDAWFNDVTAAVPAQAQIPPVNQSSIRENDFVPEAKPDVQPSRSNNSQSSSSNSDEAWFKEDMPVAESQTQIKSSGSPIRKAIPIETISQSSSLSSPAIIDHNDLEEDIDEDAWGLTEEEKAKRASIRASRGGADLATAFKAFVEKEKASAAIPGQRSAPLIDLTEEDETGTPSKGTEDAHQKVNETTLDAVSTPLLHNPKEMIQRETCMISQRSIAFITLTSSILDDILAIEDEDEHALGLDTKYLIDALNDVLDLHRALMPVGHAETLNNVPTLAAQFANDCTYIAKELIKLDDKLQHNSTKKESKLFSLKKHADLTLLLGQRSFDAQMLVQQRILAECLADARGFEATYDEQRFQTCMRSIRQVVVVLQQLHSAWKPVLTFSAHQAAMGRLVDSVLQRVLGDITGLEDISEVEGEKLSTLVKSLSELEDIFREEKHKEEEQPSSDVAIHVSSWFKASYLSDILTGSLVDIEFLYFEAGALIDYTREELINLIRALFSDTPKRSRLIERIQSS